MKVFRIVGTALAVPASYLTIWVLVYGAWVSPHVPWLSIPSNAFYAIVIIWGGAGAIALPAAALWVVTSFVWISVKQR